MKWYLFVNIAVLGITVIVVALFYLGKLYIKVAPSRFGPLSIPEFSLRVEVDPEGTREIREGQGGLSVTINISGWPNESLSANRFLPMIENMLLVDGKSGQVSVAKIVYTLPPEGGVVEVKGLTASNFIANKLRDSDYMVSVAAREVGLPRRSWFLSCVFENHSGSKLSEFRTAPIKTLLCRKNNL